MLCVGSSRCVSSRYACCATAARVVRRHVRRRASVRRSGSVLCSEPLRVLCVGMHVLCVGALHMFAHEIACQYLANFKLNAFVRWQKEDPATIAQLKAKLAVQTMRAEKAKSKALVKEHERKCLEESLARGEGGGGAELAQCDAGNDDGDDDDAVGDDAVDDGNGSVDGDGDNVDGHHGRRRFRSTRSVGHRRNKKSKQLLCPASAVVQLHQQSHSFTPPLPPPGLYGSSPHSADNRGPASNTRSHTGTVRLYRKATHRK